MEFDYIEEVLDELVALWYYLLVLKTKEIDIVINKDMLNTVERTISVVDYLISNECINKCGILLGMQKLKCSIVKSLTENTTTMENVYKLNKEEIFFLEEAKKIIHDCCKKKWAVRQVNFFTNQ